MPFSRRPPLPAPDHRARRCPAVLPLAVLLASAAACSEQIPKYEREAFATDPPPSGPFNGKLVVTNFGDDSLSVLDPETRDTLWRIPVGFVPVELEGPHHLSADPGGRFIYVNLSQAVPGSGSGPHGAHGTGVVPGFVLKIDARDGRLLGQVQVDRNPGDNLLSADGKTLYVTHYDLLAWLPAIQAGTPRKGDSRLAIVDTETMSVRRFVTLCPAAHGITLSPDGKTLFASCMPDQIAILDLTQPEAQARRVFLSGATERATCSGCPYALGTAPDGRIWAGLLGSGNNARNGFIGLYDGGNDSFDLVASLRFCGGALFPAFGQPEAGGAYTTYVPEQGPCGDAVRIFQVSAPGAAPVETGRVELPSTDCRNAHSIHLYEQGRVGVVVCEGDHIRPGTVVWVDLVNRTVLKSTPVGVFPDDLELIPPAP
jgi:YVTN family beta-propeller protein